MSLYRLKDTRLFSYTLYIYKKKSLVHNTRLVAGTMEPVSRPDRYIELQPERKLEDLEEFLQFHHELPVGLDEIVPEVFLAHVYALSAYL